MSNDNPDKTVFKMPTPGGDRTSMRPTPGARTQQNPEAQRVNPPSGQSASPSYSGTRDLASFRGDTCSNKLVSAAATLIAVFEKTRQSLSHPDVGGLHQSLCGEIKAFEARLRDLGYKQEVVLSARYFVCSVLDEAVLNTPWGSESAWGQRTLLSVFHGETSGGEKSFLILDRLRQAPAENIDIIEFIYICISLGFEGKYRVIGRGRDALDQLREDLFAVIRRYRGDYERALSPTWRGRGLQKKSLSEYVPMWVLAVITLTVIFFGYSGFRYWLYVTTDPVVEQLHQLSNNPEIK